MIKSACICGIAALAAIAIGRAEEFPLTFKTIPAKDVMAFPGGYGTYVQLRLARPAGLKQEPKTTSKHPLYGVPDSDESGAFIVRLDESKGDGKGYDTVLVDLNQNGDLTDDVAGPRIDLPKEPREVFLFGPFEAPADKAVAGRRPICFAQAQIYNTQLFNNPSFANNTNITFGYVRLKAGWYLEAEVNLGAVKQKVGVFDADTNLRIGDFAKARTYKSDDEENWYFTPGDTLLVDANKSGAFERDPFDSESCPLASVLYFGAVPYRVAVSAGCKTLQVDPWKDELAKVTLTPKGEQVQSVSLAWQKTKDNWQLIRAGVDAGKIQVPPGDYRLYTVSVAGKGSPKVQVMVSGYQRAVKNAVGFRADRPNTLACGAPLTVKVTAERRTPESWQTSQLPPKSSSDSDYVLSINASVIGSGGEVYSSFGKGEKYADDPPKPSFSVTDSGGKTVGNGNLEYG